jgi:hypothetical protein
MRVSFGLVNDQLVEKDVVFETTSWLIALVVLVTLV